MDIKKIIQDSIDVKQKLLADEDMLKCMRQVINVMVDALKCGHQILFCGNGGSAADAQHLSAELSGRFYFDRPPLKAEALHCNTSYLTAVANDYGYDFVYSRMIEGCAERGDVLIGLSTSGNSKNIINAFKKAHEMGVSTIAMTGNGGGEMKNVATMLLNVDSCDTPRIQESHILIGHILCQEVESIMFGDK